MFYVQRCALMILSCHDSVGLLRLQSLQKNSSRPASELEYCSPARQCDNQEAFQERRN